ncbi:MAG: ABC transporter substrate-binding protein [Clostridia bacterium]|nr:ABC transporter substrate-binding protein [Clostridia bacterium]
MYRAYKRIAHLVVAVLLLFSAPLGLAACGGSPSKPDASAARPAASVPAGKPASPVTRYPLQVVDDLGRSVRIERAPRRVVSLGPSNTQILFAVGAGSRVVGVDQFSTEPAAARKLPKVGGLTDPDFEAIVARQPDLVLTTDINAQPVVQRLESLHVPVLVLNPKTLSGVHHDIELVGRVLDLQAQAAAVVRAMTAREERVESRVADIPASRRVKVYYEVWENPEMTAGPGSFIDDLIRRAGGVNIADDAQSPWPEYSVERIVAHDPDVILTPFAAGYQQLLHGQRPAWSSIRAVRQHRVYLVPQNLVSQPGPDLVQALELIARDLYPDRFAAGR